MIPKEIRIVMIRIKHLIIAGMVSLFLVACSGSNNKNPEKSPAELYLEAQQQLQQGNFKGAATALETLDNRYPFGPYTQQVLLDLMYAYYKNGDFALAQTIIERFVRLHPQHPAVDYAIYMNGLSDMALDDSTLQRFFGIDRSDRDPIYARAAFEDFSRLLKSFPNSKYASDVEKRMQFLKERLAKHELSVVQFYTKRGAWIAVINRVRQMMRDFPDVKELRTALPLMENAYRRLNLNSEADKVQKIIALNSVAAQ